MIPDRLKKIIFRKLYDDLSHVEIIPFNNSIWFVDRDEKYWYFELQKDGTVWWRYQFFTEFFILFSLVRDEFQSILAQWVEEVLNSRVDTTGSSSLPDDLQVEELLNSRVIKTSEHYFKESETVEDILNSKVNTTVAMNFRQEPTVEEVLNSRVIKTYKLDIDSFTRVEEVLNSKVNTTPCVSGSLQEKVDEVLNSRVLRTQVALHSTSVMAEGVLNSKGGELFDESIVDTVLSSVTQ